MWTTPRRIMHTDRERCNGTNIVSKNPRIHKFFRVPAVPLGIDREPSDSYKTCDEPQRLDPPPHGVRKLPTASSQPMKIKQEQLERLAQALVANYQAKDLMVAKVPQAQIEAKIIAIISQNFAEEEALEEE